MLATVIEISNLAEILPPSVMKGRIGLDIRIEQGSLSVGKRVKLHGLGSEEELEIVGIEMAADLHDPGLIRIHCSKPTGFPLPTGDVDGWMIEET